MYLDSEQRTNTIYERNISFRTEIEKYYGYDGDCERMEEREF